MESALMLHGVPAIDTVKACDAGRGLGRTPVVAESLAAEPEEILSDVLGLDRGVRREAYYGERSIFYNRVGERRSARFSSRSEIATARTTRRPTSRDPASTASRSAFLRIGSRSASARRRAGRRRA